METIYLVILSVGLFIRWLWSRERFSDIERRLYEAKVGEAPAVEALTKRVYNLEQQVAELRSARVRVQPESVMVKPESPHLLEEVAPLVEAAALAVEKELPPAPLVLPMPPIPAAPPVSPVLPLSFPAAEEKPIPAVAAQSFAAQAVNQGDVSTEAPAHRPTAHRVSSKQSEEWEAIVGGNWLNKLGILVLVIGIALLLGYAVPRMSPSILSATALAMSASLLAGGILFEKRERYRVFGRGLIGGGWAALYFTVYAMQSLEASRVIFNPVLGVSLLLVVALGMIGHSLRYRSETVTALAYFTAFATLAITPLTTLSVVALIPLAASLLFLAHRFSWSRMAVFGLIATYGTCAMKGDSGAPLWQVQALFSTYWLLFETFDILRAGRRTPYNAWDRIVFALNIGAFAELSYIKWSAAAPAQVYALAAGIAVACLVSSIVRTGVRPPSSFSEEAGETERAFSGGYQGPLTVTAVLLAVALLLKFQGESALAGLLVEAELFFLAGLIFRAVYPRRLAAALFGTAFVKLITADIPGDHVTVFARLHLKSWTPVTALAALLFYANRAMRKVDVFYGYAGTAALALIIGFEASHRYLGLSWFVLAACLFAFGWVMRLRDFRIQGYVTAGLGLVGTAAYEVAIAAGSAPAARHPWIALAFAAALSYAAILTALRSAPDRLDNWERSAMERCGCWAVTGLLMALIWRVLPVPYVGVGWLVLALILLELGLREMPSGLRQQAYLSACLGSLWVLCINVLPVHNAGPWGERLAIAGASLAAYAMATRAFMARKKPATAGELDRVIDFASTVGTLFAAVALWALLPQVAVAPAWAVLALALSEIGLAFDRPGLRLQSQIVGVASFARLFFANFAGISDTAGISHRVLTVAPVVVFYYYQWWQQRTAQKQLRDREKSFGRFYVYAAAIATATLLRFELGRVLTVIGWAVFALVLVIAGERWNVRDLRWQSYLLAAITFFRSWTTNFYAPESLQGTLGRVVAGGIVIACFYAAELISPRSPDDRSALERYPRLFYAALATALLTILLFYEISGGMLTMSWAIEGVALLIAGFPLRDRVLRLLGLSLFLVCILKLFLYDLRQLETFYRIVSFIVLGLILLSVSWIYTRFRSRIERYL